MIGEEPSDGSKVIVSPGPAPSIVWRNDPAPLSFVFVTMSVAAKAGWIGVIPDIPMINVTIRTSRAAKEIGTLLNIGCLLGRRLSSLKNMFFDDIKYPRNDSGASYTLQDNLCHFKVTLWQDKVGGKAPFDCS
jgi:hypothetical protein